MCGIEYDKACRMIEKFNDKMKIRISRPLVTETSDYYNIVDIFKHRLTDKNRLYVFMGHGSDHFANAAYPALDYHFKNADMNNVFVGTVEGFPDLETVISHAIKTDIKNVTLLPFMLVCGDHAKNDMAVEWKEEFENNGLNLPFQFAIYNKNEKIIYSSNQYDPKIEGNLFTQAIFPNDPPAKINYLKVYFPTKRDYISSSVKFMIPSFAFTFILLVTFLFTIITAFRQKKLTEMKNDFINNMTHEFQNTHIYHIISSPNA